MCRIWKIYIAKYVSFDSIYSQISSNDHLYKTTTRLRQPVLSPPKQIPIESLLYETTSCQQLKKVSSWKSLIFM